jgi:hypothetical protein
MWQSGRFAHDRKSQVRGSDHAKNEEQRHCHDQGGLRRAVDQQGRNDDGSKDEKRDNKFPASKGRLPLVSAARRSCHASTVHLGIRMNGAMSALELRNLFPLVGAIYAFRAGL